MNRIFRHATFWIGLASIGWVGAGYLGTSLLALAMTLLIGAFYLMGAFELRRFHQATASLAESLAGLSEPLTELRPWLERVHPSLRNPVRRRIEGEPATIPGPAMAPYLAGLLVLLGMLGTFAGMVVTLRGTGLALEAAADLQAMRNSLVAPVAGLGLAFGTSVAGVAASAALGLLSALCRRERLRVTQQLDACIPTALRAFSATHRQEAALALQQRQADLVPVLLERMQAMMDAMERQAQASNAQLLERQQRFHEQTESVYAGLVTSVGQSLQASAKESAQVAGDAIRPVAEATMAAIARETATLHAALAGTFEQRSASLLDAVTQRHAEWQGEMAASVSAMARDTASMQERIAQASAAQLASAGARLDEATQRVADTWSEALAQHSRVSEEVSGHTRQALADASAAFERHTTSLLGTVERAHADLQAASVAQDRQRMADLAQGLETMAASLQRDWQRSGAEMLAQQQRVCDAMAQAARDIGSQAEAQARDTTAEVARLLQAAAEAPRAAAEVIAELRGKLSDSTARDNALLEERARILETLGTLLDAVNRAATEQRGAIDALVSASGELLERVGARFGDQVDAGAGQLAGAAGQVAAGAAEVASLGESFGLAVELFSQSNDKLGAQLQRIEAALGASMSRSDEQLAYYVAQAREVIDLSVMSQKQVIDELQRLAAARPAPAGVPA